MAKNKKRVKSRSARAGGSLQSQHKEGKPGQKLPSWLIPMVVGGASVFALFVGVPWLLGVFFKAPVTTDRTAPVATKTDSGDVKPNADSNAEKTASRPTSRQAPTRGLLARLPQGDATSQFGGDSGLAGDFATARDDLTGGKSAMAVRNRLGPLLSRANDNPGREHLLASLAYTELKTRDGQTAAGHLDELLEKYPKSAYSAQARVMRVEADLLAASPRGKGQQADPVALEQVISRAEALAVKETDPEARAYAKYVVASAYDVLNQDDKATAAYLELATQYPEAEQAPSALFRAGSAQQKSGKIEEAIATYQNLIEAYPTENATKEARKAVQELRLIGKPAPELRVEDWASGGPSSMSDLKGKVVLVNFWQTWCPHCREEWPHLAERYNKYKDRGFVVIGATRNDKRQDEQKLQEFLEDNPVPFPVARVNQQSARDYAISGIPAAALVDRQGIIRWRSHPGNLTDGELERYLAEN